MRASTIRIVTTTLLTTRTMDAFCAVALLHDTYTNLYSVEGRRGHIGSPDARNDFPAKHS